ncbi:MAG TPA: translation elongation factor-like protein [bacterium]|uniref:Translation elongation factor-like protein n=1 Tax=candidate division TA06 bacterium ADurb.Bin417 TaxID=1852828 RepID=A0A1V5MIM1_UNCT6|nr:MAG: hypothetical protein BWY73_00485 [candidate division TA06 bacterium ADurb.Bin417]HNQ36274.1 translation elongation factor-like protein [bacterium]
MEEKEIGVVADFFGHIGVMALKLTGELKVGDKIHVRGHTTDLTQVVDSIQVEHEKIDAAAPGMDIGIKVTEKVRHGDRVYRVTE